MFKDLNVMARLRYTIHKDKLARKFYRPLEYFDVILSILDGDFKSELDSKQR